MTECQRCAGNLKYTIMAYDGTTETPVTIDKTCEPCINTATQKLEDEVDFLLKMEVLNNDALKPARGCILGLLLGFLGWAGIATIVICIYIATH